MSAESGIREDRSSVLSASAVMAAGTMLSRLTGFVRAAMIVAALGVHLHADTFNVANTIPTMLYILLAGGVFNSVLVPQLVRSMKHDRDGGEAYLNRILTLSTIALGAATALMVAGAPWLMRVFLESVWFTPALAPQLASLIDLSRYCLVQVFFYGMFVLLGQVLNARGRFGPMTWAPIANNAVAIAVLALYLSLYGSQGGSGAYTDEQELILGLGATLGIAVQTAVLLPYLRALGVRPRPRFDFLHTGLGQTLRLGMWTVLFVAVNQIAFTVVVRLATNGSAQAVIAGVSDATGYTVYANAFLLIMVPHSVITVSLITVTLPMISRLAADGRLAEVGSELSRSLRICLAAVVPLAVGVAVLAAPIAAVVFGWGAGKGQTAPLGLTLAAFAPGLVLFTVHYAALRGFYAIEDTRTPFLIQCVIAAVNIALAISLTDIATPYNYASLLALAYGGSYLVGAALSIGLLSHRLGGLRIPSLAGFAVRVLAASGAAAVAAWLAVAALERLGAQLARKPDALAALFAATLLGLAVFLGAASLLRIEEVGEIRRTLLRRLRPERQPLG